MPPEAHLCHCTTRRLRIRIPSLRGSEPFFRDAAARLSSLPEVESVEANPLTGSILIHHRGGTRAVCEAMRREGIVELCDPAATRRTTVRQDIIGGLKAVDAHLSRATGGKVDLWDAAGLAFIGAGAYQMLRGNFMAPAWYTAFWYAFGILARAPSRDRSPE
jgi:hypothetical protein